MSDDDILMPQKQATEILLEVTQHLADWPIRSAEGFRNAALYGAVGMNPLLNLKNNGEAIFIKNMLQRVITEGRMIDFGFIPNEIIKAESLRAREAFETNELQHPYSEWLGVSAWEGGMNGYLISPSPYDSGEIIVLELYGVSVPGVLDVIFVYDIVSIKVIGPGHTNVAPTEMQDPEYNRTEELQKRGANSLDPLVAMLRFLADATIPVIDCPAPERLNRKRLAQGKFLIPAHSVVQTRDYISAFHATKHARGEDRGGHHSSPVSHWRRAHMRNLSDGRVIPVRSAKVNWRDVEDFHRLFYRTGGPNG